MALPAFRRFNDAFKQVMRLTLTQVRKQEEVIQNNKNYIDLAFKGPLDWEYMLQFYRLRAIEGLEYVSDKSYQRNFVINGASGTFIIYPIRAGVLRAEFELSDHFQLRAFVNQLRRMFDLDSDILTIENALRRLNPS